MSGRQQAFEQHVEKFNNIEPRLKGQTLDYEAGNAAMSEQRRHAHSTIQHPMSRIPDTAAAYSAINSIEETRARMFAPSN